nr:aquaporin [Lysobacter lactosilyticus]
MIVALGPVSGAHFNPVVTLAMRLRGALTSRETAAYIAVQVIAAIVGVALAHGMFDQALLQPGTHAREGTGQWLSEGIATFGLLLTILLGIAHRPAAVPALVAAYILAAYWFTGSTSFANPAVTFARSLTQSFAGIRPRAIPDVRFEVAAECPLSTRADIEGTLKANAEMTGTPMMELDVNGEAPGLAGKACEAVLLQQYWHKGVLVEPANVIHMRFSGVWHRLYFDYGIVFWRISDAPPEPGSDTDYEWEYPLEDLGAAAEVIGIPLDHYSMKPVVGGSTVELCFETGKRIIFENVDDHTTYRVV